MNLDFASAISTSQAFKQIVIKYWKIGWDVFRKGNCKYWLLKALVTCTEVLICLWLVHIVLKNNPVLSIDTRLSCIVKRIIEIDFKNRKRFTLLNMFHNPQSLSGSPTSHGHMILGGSAGRQRVHRGRMAQDLVFRNWSQMRQWQFTSGLKHHLRTFFSWWM